MEKWEIFNYARDNYDNSLEDTNVTAFKIIENILNSICVMDIAEDEKRKKMAEIFSRIKGSRDRKIMGVKRDDLADIINSILPVSSGDFSNPGLKKMNLDEIYYYYCVTQRIINSKMDFTYERRREEEQREKERIRLEEDKEKIALQKKKEEEARAAALAAMSQVERKIYEIKLSNDENRVTELYNMIDDLNQDERIQAAEFLKEFWIKSSKWEGKGLSKKQKPKAEKVKGILSAKK